jgi:hypothetical protein
MNRNPHEREGSGPPAPRQPPNKDNDVGIVKSLAPSRVELKRLALELYDKGFNVIPVGPGLKRIGEKGISRDLSLEPGATTEGFSVRSLRSFQRTRQG